jgi:lipopolysaccharide export LptBFGC system permease protein LptF
MALIKRYALPFGAGLFAMLLTGITQSLSRTMGLAGGNSLSLLDFLCLYAYFYGVVKLSKSKQRLAANLTLTISIIGYVALLAFLSLSVSLGTLIK